MKRILKKRIVPLLCVGLLFSTPHTMAYATGGGIESIMASATGGGIEHTTGQREKSEPAPATPPPAKTPPAEETTPPPAKTPPTEETTPPPAKNPPAEEATPPPAKNPPTEETTPPPVEKPPVEEATPPAVEKPPTEETTPPAVETPPAEETTPPAVEKPPAEKPPEQISYSVEIAWQSLEFDCVPLWNPDEHCYDEWESTENPITVTNTTKNGAPIRVTLTFIPVDKKGATAVFAPCEDDPHPEDFTFSHGQVSFLLPRDGDSQGQATLNLLLAGNPMVGETEQYNQIGSIKMEFTPFHEGTENLETVTPGASDIQTPPESDLPLSKPEPLPGQPDKPEPPAESEQLPPPEGQPPKIETEKPVQESAPEAKPPPEHNLKEETHTAPHTESGALP